MSDVTIWHNPGCSTSRKVLGMIRERGIAPRIVDYLKTPPSRAEVAEAARRAGLPLRGLLRQRGTPFAELGLGDPGLTEEQLLDAIAAHPVLIERPVVFGPRGVRLCRPAEAVFEVL